MTTPPLEIRRGCRRDFAAVMRLLSAAPSGEPDRRTLRRFRNIVGDLGSDLYVAELGGKVVGVIHASYVRQLRGGQAARVEDLSADAEYDQHAIEQRLLEFILARARRRACAWLSCRPAGPSIAAVAEAAGLQPRDTEYARFLDDPPV